MLDALYSLEHPDEVEADADVDPKVGDPVVEGEAEDEARVRRKLHSLTRVALELSGVVSVRMLPIPRSLLCLPSLCLCLPSLCQGGLQ